MLFKALGILVALYTVLAAGSGRVYAKRGFFGHTLKREESPGDFWLVIACYAVLAFMLVVVF